MGVSNESKASKASINRAIMFEDIVDRYRLQDQHCCSKSHHVACLIKGTKKVVSSASNDYRRQYVGRKNHASLHAERSCIKDINRNRSSNKIKKNLTLLVLRFRKDGTLCDSRPCAECKEYLINNGLIFVFCSIADGSIQKIFLKDLPNYLSKSQIQFKIFGLQTLTAQNLKKLHELGYNMDSLNKKGLHEQLQILRIVKSSK